MFNVFSYALFEVILIVPQFKRKNLKVIEYERILKSKVVELHHYSLDFCVIGSFNREEEPQDSR